MKTTLMVTAAIALALAACNRAGDAKEDAKIAADAAAPATPAAGAESPDGAGAVSGADNAAKSEKFLADNSKKAGVKTTASGLQYEVLSEGPASGVSPKATDLVDVHYVGTLIDGVEFDSSRARGAAARFPLNQVIPGWTEGVQLMSEGDRYRFYVPAELGYGEQGTPGGPIGPNETLIFDVELLKVTNADRNLEGASKFLADNGKKSGIKTTASGLQYEVLTEGKAGGKQPTDASKVSVHYEGRLVNGTVFDSSYARGEPIEFPLNAVIPGWTEGVQLMSEGDKFRLYIPPALGYGAEGTPGGPIGPNEALVFDVELLKVVD
ncbi:MAG: FKBP-type peptidyl-prolyl cis-trans isomerase [Parvularculaceae bacterium]|nr:FKBP-type peptidyl-prolyl cis-trans isomerase [Parvularculaceae bacterium]